MREGKGSAAPGPGAPRPPLRGRGAGRRRGILGVLQAPGERAELQRAQAEEIGNGHHDGGLAAEVDHFMRSGVRPPGFVAGGLPGLGAGAPAVAGRRVVVVVAGVVVLAGPRICQRHRCLLVSGTRAMRGRLWPGPSAPGSGLRLVAASRFGPSPARPGRRTDTASASGPSATPTSVPAGTPNATRATGM